MDFGSLRHFLPLCAVFASSSLPAQQADEPATPTARATLDNGLSLSVSNVPGPDIAVFALAIEVGSHDDPVGRGGLAHLLEHMFLHGGTESAQDPFATLSKDGPTGQPFADCNAETLGEFTYYYAVRPSASLEETATVFAEKLRGMRFEQALLDRERPRVLQEIHNVARVLETNPRLRQQAELMSRRPKAGRAGDVESLTLEQVQQWHDAHRDPSRCAVTVLGNVDPEDTMRMLRTVFDPLSVPASADDSVPSREVAVTVAAKTLHVPDDVTDRDRIALRMAAEILARRTRRALRSAGAESARTWVELLAGGSVRVVARADGAEDDPLALARTTLEATVQNLTANEDASGAEPPTDRELRTAARSLQRAIKPRLRGADVRYLPPTDDTSTRARQLAQAAIDGLFVARLGGVDLQTAASDVDTEHLADVLRAAVAPR